VRLWHFTSPYNVSAILLTGILRRTDDCLFPGPATIDTTSGNAPREVVHLTAICDPDRQPWARHANLKTGGADFYSDGDLDKRRIRFTVNESRVMRWIDAAEKAGSPQRWIDALAHGNEAEMPFYYVCDRDIPRRKWRLVEDTRSGAVYWRRPMLHEYPEAWRTQTPFFFDFASGRDVMLERLNEYLRAWATNPHVLDRWPDRAAKVMEDLEGLNTVTVDAWWHDYEHERTEDEWIEHLRTSDEYAALDPFARLSRVMLPSDYTALAEWTS
jgi:hypothetical protein